jgi:hypothetical protein
MVNSKGAVWGLLIGEFVGVTRILTDMLVKGDILNYSILHYYKSINFLHFAIISFVISSFSVIAISYFTSKENRIRKSIKGLSDLPGIWNLEFNLGKIKTIRETKTNFVLSAFIVLVILGLWSIWY